MIDRARDFSRTRNWEFGRRAIIQIDGITVGLEDILDESIPAEVMAMRVESALAAEAQLAADRDRYHREQARTDTTSEAAATNRIPPESSVSESLDRILAWIQTALPSDAAFTGASLEQLNLAEERSSLQWPAEVRDVFRHISGATLQLLPTHDLLTIEGSIRIRAMWLEIMSDLRTRHSEMSDALDPNMRSAQNAGTPAGIYLPEFIPIADRDGATLFVDTRGGEMHCCVTEYTSAGADDDGPIWPSISAMLDDLATSFETRSPFLGWQPGVNGGRIQWTALPANH